MDELLINCAIGERGVGNSVDDALMEHIDIATIACSAHAGDRESIGYYRSLADEKGVKVAAYLSYPSKKSLDGNKTTLEHDEVIVSLNEQAEVFGPIELLKFQGLLYTHVNRSPELAERIGAWLHEKGIKEVIAPYRSMLHKACISYQIPVLYEAYADREYNDMTVGLELLPQNQLGQELENDEAIIRQVKKLKQGVILVGSQNYFIEAETLCFNSHADDAVSRAKLIKDVILRRRR